MKYQQNWTSLTKHPVPQWFHDAKFGIYTHWGVYSVPAYGSNGTWYPNKMYRDDTSEHRHHIETYGPLSKFGYKDFVQRFTASKFDAEEWAEVFAGAGARFAGPVAEHHDGFSMWPSRVNAWNAKNMGPKRDIVGELEKAIRAKNMRFITTFHHAHNWWFFPVWDDRFDCADPVNRGMYPRAHGRDEPPDREYLEQWRDKIYEVIERYKPDLLWFDFGLGKIRDTYRREMVAHYYNKSIEWDREVGIIFKEIPKGWSNLPPGAGIVDFEVGKMNEMTHHVWISDTSIDAGPRGTWSHVANVGYKSAERLIHTLVDNVSKNGHLLLNVGPRADGSIPEQVRETLATVGRWLEVNGEAIFGTTPWFSYGTGPTRGEGGSHFTEDNEARFTSHDFRFTVKESNLYVSCLGKPGDSVTIDSLKILHPDEIESIQLLGREENLRWKIDHDGLTIETPRKGLSDVANCFRVRLTPTVSAEDGAR